MVDSWTPASGVVVGAGFGVDAADATLDLRVKHQSGATVPVRVRLRREWIDGSSTPGIEAHVHRILTIVSDRNLEADANSHDESTAV